jgi:predicted membrane chloride channel (bestrophin family)
MKIKASESFLPTTAAGKNDSKTENLRTFGMLRFLFMWKSSIYKLIYGELCIWIVVYYVIGFVHTALPPSMQTEFEAFAKYTSAYLNWIPLAFVLSFFMGHVYARWWDQYLNLPKTAGIAHLVSSLIVAPDQHNGVVHGELRRKLLRWVHASVGITYQSISPTYKAKFPTLLALEDEGLLTPKEREYLEPLSSSARAHVLLAWFKTAVSEYDRSVGGKLSGSSMLATFHDQLMSFAGSCGKLREYNARPIPIGYTQIISLCVYTYFAFTLVARQQFHDSTAVFSVPLCSIIQFAVYVGWLKVAEEMLYPFGDDDDDFNCEAQLRQDRELAAAIEHTSNWYPANGE